MDKANAVLGLGWGIYLGTWEREGKGSSGHAAALARLKREYGHLELTERQWRSVETKMRDAIQSGRRINQMKGDSKLARGEYPINPGIGQPQPSGKPAAYAYRITYEYSGPNGTRRQSHIVYSDRNLTKDQLVERAREVAWEWARLQRTPTLTHQETLTLDIQVTAAFQRT